MARVNVFLKDSLIEEINKAAKAERTNRSSLIQKALTEYLEAKREKRREQAKRKKMEEACRKMDELAKKAGDWDPVAIIRRFRDSGWRETP